MRRGHPDREDRGRTWRAVAAATRAGFETLRDNPLRTALSTLGIVVGVASLVAVLALGNGMERHARAVLGGTSLQILRVIPRTTVEGNDGQRIPNPSFPVFTMRDASEVRRLPHVSDVSLWVGGTSTLRRVSDKHRESASVVAALSNAAEFDGLDLRHGRFFADVEVSRNHRVMVLSTDLAEQLTDRRPGVALLGEWIYVGRKQYRVIGIFASQEGDEDKRAYLPVGAAEDLFTRGGRSVAPLILVRASSLEGVALARAALQDWIATRFGDPDEQVTISSYRDLLVEAQRGIALFKLVMGVITGISLLVGGIGIMNVLLASVAERTREIGVRRAMGARRRDIFAQFIAESVAIASIGSVIGIALGTLGALALALAVRWLGMGASFDAIPSPNTLFVAFAIPALVGLAFGTYPARRAAALSPIEAIRHD